MEDARSSGRFCVVVTTPERFHYFAAVLGDEVDRRFDQRETVPLYDFLRNVALAGGRLVILDDAHFCKPGEMLEGVMRFVDDASMAALKLRLVIVCSRRGPGDPLLTSLVAYCGIHDVLYGVQGADISLGISKLLACKNTRLDVLDVLREVV